MNVQITATITVNTELWLEFEGYDGETEPGAVCALEKRLLEEDREGLLNLLAENTGWDASVEVVATSSSTAK